jgi:hypothetical protein
VLVYCRACVCSVGLHLTAMPHSTSVPPMRTNCAPSKNARLLSELSRLYSCDAHACVLVAGNCVPRRPYPRIGQRCLVAPARVPRPGRPHPAAYRQYAPGCRTWRRWGGEPCCYGWRWAARVDCGDGPADPTAGIGCAGGKYGSNVPLSRQGLAATNC